MIKPKIKNELKEIDNVVKDIERLRNMHRRIIKRTEKNKDYLNKASKSIKKYTKANFSYHNNIITDIDCNKLYDEYNEFRSEYEHFDKLTHHLSKLNSSNNKLANLLLAIKKSYNNNDIKIETDIISNLYFEEHIKMNYKIIKHAIFKSNINSSQILAIITWISNDFKTFLIQQCKLVLKNYYKTYNKKIKYVIKHASKMYVVNIERINHNFLIEMINNALINNNTNETKWLNIIEGIYYTGIVKLLFSFVVENIKIVNDAKSKILNFHMFLSTLEYIKFFCTNYLAKLNELDILTLNYIIANVNNSNKMIEMFNRYLEIVQNKYKIKINKTKSINIITTISMMFIVFSSNFRGLLVSHIIKVLDNVFKNADCNEEYKNYMGNIICDTVDDYCNNDIKPYLEGTLYDLFTKDLFNRIISKMYTLLNNYGKYEKCIKTIELYFIDILDDPQYIQSKIKLLPCIS